MASEQFQLEREEEDVLITLGEESVLAFEAPGGVARPTCREHCFQVGALLLRGATPVIITGYAVDIGDDEVFRIAADAFDPEIFQVRPSFAALERDHRDPGISALMGEMLVPCVVSTVVSYGPQQRAGGVAVDTGILLQSANGARLLVETPNAELGDLPMTIAPLDLLLTTHDALIEARLSRADTHVRPCLSRSQRPS